MPASGVANGSWLRGGRSSCRATARHSGRGAIAEVHRLADAATVRTDAGRPALLTVTP
jgi:hypothetical protein